MHTTPVALLLLSLAAEPAWLEDRFEIPAGFRIHRAAGQDLSGGSYDIAFDGQGRLLAGDGEEVRRLEDRDGDGIFDRAEVIARGLGPRGPQGLLVWGDRLYAVGGDGVQLFEGYLSGGPLVHRGRIGQPFSTGGDHAAHTVLRGHDGFVYFITGDGGGTRERVHITEETSPALFERSASVFRVSPDGARWECFGTGGRNPPNLGINHLGDLFSLDSDMEWHVDLPWWRPVRLNHWTAGGDQGWQEVGAYPPYYIDNLPGIDDVGRGSPDWGVFYEHRQLPERYRDSYLVCDYPSKSATTGGYETVGRLFAFFLERDGAGWKATHEVLARPKPGARDENGRPIQFALVDIEVAPDGSILLSDHNQGIWRIVHDAGPKGTAAGPLFPPWPPLPAGEPALIDALLSLPQPASEWSRLREEEIRAALGNSARHALEEAGAHPEAPIERRLRAVRLLAPGVAALDAGFLDRLARDPAWQIRAQAAWLLGTRGKPGEVERIEALLDDTDSFVRRRAAEALARSHGPGTPAKLIARLSDPVRLVRYVAMTSLAHHATGAWLEAALARSEPQARMRALVAADLRRERPPAEAVRGVAIPLMDAPGSGASREDRLDLLRILGRFREAVQGDDASRARAARHLLDSLGDPDRDIRWEAARLLGEYRVTEAFGRLIAALEAEEDNVTEFHLAQALARIPRGWTEEEEERAVRWFLARQKGWFAEPGGKGLQFPDFWRTVLSEMGAHHRDAFRRRLGEIDFSGPLGGVALDLVAESPDAAAVLIARWRAIERPEARQRIASVLGGVPDPAAGVFLREEYLRTTDAGLRGAVIRGLARREPAAEDIPFLLEGLAHDDEDAVRASLGALSRWKGLGPDEALSARLIALLLRRERIAPAAEDLLAKASGKERPGRRREGGRRRRPSEEEVEAARAFWKAWYAETFAREFDPSLAAPPGEKGDEEVRAFLASDRARGGDAARGRKVYIGARCAACHGGAGEPGKEERLFGPDLSGVTLRLKPEEIVDAIVYPSKQVADRFKGTLVLVHGRTPVTGFITGDSPEAVTIADQDRVHRIPRGEIESVVPLETSLMPERLLSRLSWEEIRDMNAFLEEIGRRPVKTVGRGEWPGWRGPGGRGVSEEKALPARWSPSEGVAWSRDLEGWGDSSPAVAGGRVHVTAQTDDDALHVVAMDAVDGRLIWKTTVGGGRLKAHKLHNMATPTPAADGERVWALFGTGDFACLDREGGVLWRRNLAADHGEYRILWGMGSSPLLHGGLLHCLCLHGGPSYVLAVDPATGKDVWKAPRDLRCRAEASDSYSTPVIIETGGRSELIVGGCDHVNAYDPATGKELWIASGMGIDHDWGRTIASPAVGDGTVFVPSASVQGLGKLVAIRAGGEGDVTSSRRLWQYEKFTPDCPSPLHHEGLVYAVRDDGVGSCLDAKTGELLWKKRLGHGEFKASPVAGDGKVYFLATDGECVVLEAGREGKVIAENRLEGSFIATPAIAGGRIYLRAAGRVYAVGPAP